MFLILSQQQRLSYKIVSGDVVGSEIHWEETSDLLISSPLFWCIPYETHKWCSAPSTNLFIPFSDVWIHLCTCFSAVISFNHVTDSLPTFLPMEVEHRRGSIDIFLKAAGYLDCAVRYVLPQLPSELRFGATHMVKWLSLLSQWYYYTWSTDSDLISMIQKRITSGPCWRSSSSALPTSTGAGIIPWLHWLSPRSCSLLMKPKVLGAGFKGEFVIIYPDFLNQSGFNVSLNA